MANPPRKLYTQDHNWKVFRLLQNSQEYPADLNPTWESLWLLFLDRDKPDVPCLVNRGK
jgi:hypothetical protein